MIRRPWCSSFSQLPIQGCSNSRLCGHPTVRSSFSL